mgnify:FL=1
MYFRCKQLLLIPRCIVNSSNIYPRYNDGGNYFFINQIKLYYNENKKSRVQSKILSLKRR